MDRLKKTLDSVMVMKTSGLQTASANACILSWVWTDCIMRVPWGPMAPWGQALRATGLFHGRWMGSTLVARAAGGSRTSPSPGRWALPWEWTEERLGHRLVDEPDSVNAQLSKAGLWGAGNWPCCDSSGAGAEGLGGLKWGPGLWAGFESTWEGWPGSVSPVYTSMSLDTIFTFIWLYLKLFLFFEQIIFIMNCIAIKEVAYHHLSGLPAIQVISGCLINSNYLFPKGLAVCGGNLLLVCCCTAQISLYDQGC